MSRSHVLRSLGLLFLAINTQALAVAPAQESWDSVYIAGTKVGHVHTTVEPFKDRGRDRVRVLIEMALRFQRLDATVTVRMRQTTVETRAGAVESLDIRTLAGGPELHVAGSARNGRMVLTLDGTTQRQRQTLDWGPDVRGPYAVEQSLAQTPMKPGETRTLKMFLTDLNRVCDITLKALQIEDVPPAPGGAAKRPLLRIEQTATLDGKSRPEFAMTLWADATGEVQKSSSDNLGGMVTYRTTKSDALAPAPAGVAGVTPFDGIASTVIKVSPPLDRPTATRDVIYRVTFKDGDPAQVLPADRRQSLRPDPSGAKDSALLQVKTAGPDADAAGPEADPEFLRPSAMIDSRDSRIIALARKAVGNASDPWEKAVRIERWVAENLKDKNFQVAFAPASEVARTLAGDCTEHGVLTAAMCRAQGIPARVVLGLVYAKPLGGFGFHLWNEVHVQGRWVALDAAYNQSSVDATHIKLSESSLDGIAPFEAFLPVVRVLGKLTVVPVEVH